MKNDKMLGLVWLATKNNIRIIINRLERPPMTASWRGLKPLASLTLRLAPQLMRDSMAFGSPKLAAKHNGVFPTNNH